jgi:hypothetical protein
VPSDILGVPPLARGKHVSDARSREGPRARIDPLLRLMPAHYVEVLLGRRVTSSRKIHCPFHPGRIPSFHVYPSPAEGWTCFGWERPDGSPLGGDIYTLASLLWDIPARGPDFLRLRSRLEATFGVNVPEAELYIVYATDVLAAALAGTDGCQYESPPQTESEARTLIRILLSATDLPEGGGPWLRPLAGGCRRVSLHTVAPPSPAPPEA